MSSQDSGRKRDWINLDCTEGAKLQAGTLNNGQLVLIITGLPINSRAYGLATQEPMDFKSSGKGRFLVKALQKGESFKLAPFKAIWPNAHINKMLVSDFTFDVQGIIDRKARKEKEDSKKAEREAQALIVKVEHKQQQENLASEVAQSTFIGGNLDGHHVYVHPDKGRFYVSENKSTGDISLFHENQHSKSLGGAFLRAGENNLFLAQCAAGLVQLALQSETLNKISIDDFISTVFNQAELTALERHEFAFALDVAMADALTERYADPASSWVGAVELEARLNGRQSLVKNAPYVAAPLAIQAQRFLEKADSIRLFGLTSPTLYAYLSEKTQLQAESKTIALASSLELRPQLNRIQEGTKSQAALFKIDHDTPVSDVLNEAVFSEIDENGLAVILTSQAPSDLIDAIAALENTHVIQFIEVSPATAKSDEPQYLCLLKRGNTQGFHLRKGMRPVQINSWDSLRAVTDETLSRMGRDDLSMFDEQTRSENSFQRPYLSFSRTSPSQTMTPKNIQAALSYALEKVEANFGPIDDFVSEELEVGIDSLADRFSAEQVDAIALAISAMLNKRGFILGDETGIGKGRTIAASAMWANKNDKKIVFVTDRSNLFSDLARDLIDINEWERFTPLITNADGDIFDIMNGGITLAQPPSPLQLQRIMKGELESRHNIIFTTYSQMNNEQSDKSKWLLEQSRDAVLILDEAHVGAGSNSNIARQIEGMVDSAESVIYSSATWAKSHENLTIYKKALPNSVSMTQVQSIMESEGESFSEVFSTMLAMDGAFIRREHDLSKIDFSLSVDDKYRERNLQITGQVSNILGQMAILSGEANNMIQRINNDTRRTLLDAQSARFGVLEAIRTELSSKKENLNSLEKVYAELSDRKDVAFKQIPVATALIDFLESVDAPTIIEKSVMLEYLKQATVSTPDIEQLEKIALQFQEQITPGSERHNNYADRLGPAWTQSLISRDETIVEYSSVLSNKIKDILSKQEVTEPLNPDQLYRIFNIASSNQEQIDKLHIAMTLKSTALLEEALLSSSLLTINESEMKQLQKEVGELEQKTKNQLSTKSRGNFFSSNFGTGSAIYTVMRRTIAALSVDHTAEKAIASAREGLRPVIVLEETGGTYVKKLIDDEMIRVQSQLDRLRERNLKGELTEEEKLSTEIATMLDIDTKPLDIVREIRIPTIQDMLRNELTRLGGIEVSEAELSTDSDYVVEQTISQASISSFIESHFKGSEKENMVSRYAKAIEAIEDEIKRLPSLAISPIDALAHKIKKAGLSVGEISGREYSLNVIDEAETDFDETVATISKRNRKKRDVTETVHAFNSGSIDIAIINKAAATGLSMHSSPRFADTRQRILFEMESDPNPNTRIQLFGRVNRFDQVSPPQITTLTLGMPSEMRNIMMQNKKLTNLSANIRSSRDNAAVNTDVPDFLNPAGDRMCQEYLLEHSGIASRLGIQMAHIERPYGLASHLMQRLNLLAPENQTKILDELTEAYLDALTEEKITFTGRDIPLKDWRAKSVDNKHAWGSPVLPDGASVFDAPVFQRLVTYKVNKDPLTWDKVRQMARINAAKLLEDERIVPVEPKLTGVRKTSFNLEAELNLTETQKDAVYARHLGAVIFGGTRESNFEGKTFPISLPLLGTPVLRKGLINVSASGETATLFFLDAADELSKERPITTYHVDLVRLRKSHEYMHDNKLHGIPVMSLENRLVERLSTILMVVPTDEDETMYKDGSGFKERFDALLSSNDPEIVIPDLSAVVDRAVIGFEAKQMTGLSSVKDAANIEEALALPSHNAVKEAYLRKLFVDKILRKISIGSLFIVDAQGSSGRRFSRFFEGKQFTVSGITLPKKGHEAALAKWKFELCTSGKEEPITISGALLKKISGDNPSEYAINVINNVFDFDKPHAQHGQSAAYSMYPRGEMTKTATLLTGNAYQASEWSRASKQGQAIIYTDESGIPHRAVEVHPSAVRRGALAIPKRLHGKDPVLNLINHLFHDKPIPSAENFAERRRIYIFARNLESAMQHDKNITANPLNQNSRVSMDDCITFIATGDGSNNSHAIDIRLPKNERSSLRNKFLATLKAHESESKSEPYFGLHENFHRVEAVRGSAKDSNRTLRIFLPAGEDRPSQLARKQIIRAFTAANGAELYSIPAITFSTKLLEKELERFYEESHQPDMERHSALVERFKKRKERRLVLEQAFDNEPSRTTSNNPEKNEYIQNALSAKSTISIDKQSPSAGGDVARQEAYALLEQETEESKQQDLFAKLMRPSA